MSGGGFFIAVESGLFHRASIAIVGLGGVRAVNNLGGVVQIIDSVGHLFTLYERVPDGTEWEFQDGSFTAAPGVQQPDMRCVVACPFECRWPDLVTRLANRISRTADEPTWVLDSDGVVWDAENVDPGEVVL